MTVNNMGTPGWPEGVPHWSIKTLMAHKLKVALKPKPPREYASLLPNEIRNVSIGDNLPDGLRGTLEKTMDRLDSHPPYSFVIYNEPAHDDCDGGVMVMDLLEGAIGGQVLQEADYAGFRPDIAIYRANSTDPSSVIEVVDTSPPSERKLRAFRERGIEVYRLGADGNPRAVLEDLVCVTPLVTSKCGKALRQAIWEIDSFWLESDAPFLGIRFHPSGAQEYLYGLRESNLDHESWSYGDPELRAIFPAEEDSEGNFVKWPSVQRVTPQGQPQTISKQLFMAYLMYAKGRIITRAHQRPRSGHNWIRLSSLEAMFIDQINDLMHMVRFPTQ